MMILQALNGYIKNAERVAEETLLKQFHLRREALLPMMAVLLKRGYIHKVVVQRGKNLPEQIFYTWFEHPFIPCISVL